MTSLIAQDYSIITYEKLQKENQILRLTQAQSEQNSCQSKSWKGITAQGPGDVHTYQSIHSSQYDRYWYAE